MIGAISSRVFADAARFISIRSAAKGQPFVLDFFGTLSPRVSRRRSNLGSMCPSRPEVESNDLIRDRSKDKG